ncbi:hypothetical protein Psed_5761 [Pseudonocardia dioxanivorans CB1190]|uniref:Uncharacterized protein n=1 Tax=Pseudonocardia dioxanivorans (strain ATCC 55486 / DSM 44775 / JCM 13855 / CB1190) TaxID=675635 RepID=F4D1A0_PSEUX|nr:hypothetical protein [Pseudonocardia dioxanivorans]AEA27888.1 hypothetical protein Psed_5761 [Pseudonocardia dioxanivorans CB1190]
MSTNDTDRYEAAAHAMQTGVLAEMHREGVPAEHLDDRTSTGRKHLRVGVNSALVGQAAIASLLIAKGIFTIEEYTAALADEMEKEQRLYEDQLGVKLR